MISKPFTVGGEGTGSDPDVYALMLRNVFGVKLKLVSGYPGTTEMALAIERGEVDGRASWSWSSLKSLKPDWIAQKKVVMPVQLNLAKSSDLPDTPLIGEFATTERQRQIMKLVLSRQTMGRPFMAPPGLPPERAAALAVGAMARISVGRRMSWPRNSDRSDIARPSCSRFPALLGERCNGFAAVGCQRRDRLTCATCRG